MPSLSLFSTRLSGCALRSPAAQFFRPACRRGSACFDLFFCQIRRPRAARVGDGDPPYESCPSYPLEKFVQEPVACAASYFTASSPPPVLHRAALTARLLPNPGGDGGTERGFEATLCTDLGAEWSIRFTAAELVRMYWMAPRGESAAQRALKDIAARLRLSPAGAKVRRRGAHECGSVRPNDDSICARLVCLPTCLVPRLCPPFPRRSSCAHARRRCGALLAWPAPSAA